MALVPAITVWQPWASLIAIRAKPYEFRTWTPPRQFVGTQIAIHAAGRPVNWDEVRELIYLLERRKTRGVGVDPDLALPLLREALTMPAALPRSVIVCTATMGAPRPCSSIFVEGGDEKWGWPMDQVKLLNPPVPAKGRQGWWWAKLPNPGLEGSAV